MMKTWVDDLQKGDMVRKCDVLYSFMGIDADGMYELYSLNYKFNKKEMLEWCSFGYRKQALEQN